MLGKLSYKARLIAILVGLSWAALSDYILPPLGLDEDTTELISYSALFFIGSFYVGSTLAMDVWKRVSRIATLIAWYFSVIFVIAVNWALFYLGVTVPLHGVMSIAFFSFEALVNVLLFLGIINIHPIERFFVAKKLKGADQQESEGN